jgi:hypothetical protein
MVIGAPDIWFCRTCIYVVDGPTKQPSIKLLAIDPGVTTGCAVKMNGAYKAFTLDLTEQVYELVNDTQWTALTYESFSSAGNISAAGHATIRLTGAIEAICYLHKIPFFVHSPQNRYTYLPKAKALLGKVIVHQVDALAHLLLLEAQLDRQGKRTN